MTVGKPEIYNWLRKICKKYNYSSFYIPSKDTYMIHFKGKALQGFNSEVFYQMPKDAREKSLIPILKRGLMININEKSYNQLFTNRHLGKTIVK
jgi:hypothetical protein